MFRLLASPWAVAIWGTLSVLVALFESLVYFRIRSQFHLWQPVEATILESWVRTYNEDLDGEYVQEPVVRFSYEYQGREYVSDTPYLRSYTLGPSFVDLANVASRFRKGDVVSARLHPEYPEVCYIDVARFDVKSVLLLTGGIVVFGVGAYFLASVLELGT